MNEIIINYIEVLTTPAIVILFCCYFSKSINSILISLRDAVNSAKELRGLGFKIETDPEAIKRSLKEREKLRIALKIAFVHSEVKDLTLKVAELKVLEVLLAGLDGPFTELPAAQKKEILDFAWSQALGDDELEEGEVKILRDLAQDYKLESYLEKKIAALSKARSQVLPFA